jgi:hypothetical protein
MAYDETGYSAPLKSDETCKSLIDSLRLQIETQTGSALPFLKCIEYSSYTHYGTNFNIKAASDPNQVFFISAYQPPSRPAQLCSLSGLRSRDEPLNAPVDLRQVYGGLGPKF